MTDPGVDPVELARLMDMRAWYLRVFGQVCSRIHDAEQRGEGVLLDGPETAVLADVLRGMVNGRHSQQ